MIEDLSTTQLAIISLLRAEDRRSVPYAPIPGMTHIVKELFTVKNTSLGADLLDELQFEPDNFGPFDETIYAALEDLASTDLIAIDTIKSSRRISLTKRGKDLSDEIWNSLRDDVKDLFTYVKINFNSLSSEKLLDKIYAAYPDMIVNSQSKVALKYRQ